MTTQIQEKHTPGPWKVGGTRITVYTQDGLTIATAKRYDGLDAEANAQLIAAAPELLKACKSVIQWYEDSGNTDPAIGSVELWSQCKKAIAKAEGGEA